MAVPPGSCPWRRTGASSWLAPIRRRMAYRPIHARIWCAFAKRGLQDVPSCLAGKRLKRLAFSRKSEALPSQEDAAEAEAFKRAPEQIAEIQCTHSKRIRLFFQDEARIGQKGRVCHAWWKRGQRPPGSAIGGLPSPTSLPPFSPAQTMPLRWFCPMRTRAMQIFLDQFSKTIAERACGDDPYQQAGTERITSSRPPISPWFRCRTRQS